jgi:fructokinase
VPWNDDLKSKPKIAGLGEVLWDVHGGKKTFGGAPANCACHCSALGAQAYVVSCMGNDALGVEGRAFLTGHGVDVSGIAVNDSSATGIVNVELGPEGEPEYEIREDVAWDYIPFTDEMATIAPQLDAVCFGSLSQRNNASRSSIEKFLDATSPQCLRMFDINIRQDYYSAEVVLSSLKRASALKMNDEELSLVAGVLDVSGSDEEQMKTLLRRWNLKLAILTCGSKGAFMVTEDEESFAVSPKPETIASTVGAGDAFTAAAIMGYLQDRGLCNTNRYANAVASFVCTQPGAVPALPEKLIKEEFRP